MISYTVLIICNLLNTSQIYFAQINAFVYNIFLYLYKDFIKLTIT